MSRKTPDTQPEPIETKRAAWRTEPEPDVGCGRGMTRIQSPRAIPSEDRADALDEACAPREEPTSSDAQTTETSPAGVKATAATAERLSDHFAGHLAHTSASAFMYFSMASTLRQPDALAFKKFRDKLLADCGGPTDPVEVMLVEQLALAHLNVGRLQFQSATAEGPEAARVYGGLAVLLMGEFRRTALALRTYRIPARPTAVTPGGAATAPGAAAGGGEDSEQGSNPGGDADDGTTIPLPEPEAGRGGPTEPREAARDHRRRA